MRKIAIIFLILLINIPLVYGIKLSDDTIKYMTNHIYDECSKDSNRILAICNEEGESYKCEHSSSEISKSVINDFIEKINDKFSKGGSYHGPVVLMCTFNNEMKHFLMLKISCYEWDGGECINQVREVHVTEEYYFKDFTLFGFNIISNGGFTAIGFTLIGIGGICLLGLGITLSFLTIIKKKKFSFRNYSIFVKKEDKKPESPE